MKNSINKILFLGLILSLSISCEKEQPIEPIIHDAIELDLNNDLTNDVKIFYLGYSWDGIGPNGSGMGINGIIKPLNNTMILYKQDIGSLFLKTNDTIKYSVRTPITWINSESNLIGIKTHLNQYSNPWTVVSPDVKDQYKIGFKISNDNSTILGWLSLKINCYTGKIDIIETTTTNQDLLVID